MTETAVVENTVETTTTTEVPAKQETGALLNKTETATTDTKTAAPASWPDDWRQQYAKADEKKLKQLERYGSVDAALDSLIALKQRVNRGELQKVLGDNPTEDELKEWRSSNGVPEKPEEYKLELGDGRVVGERDKPMLDAFLKRVHSENMPEKDVNRAVKAYYEIQDEQIKQQQDADVRFEQQAEDTLRAEYGNDYRRNMTLAMSLLDLGTQQAQEKILGARTSDGKVLGSDPDVIRFLVQLAREVNPTATLVPGSSGNVETTIADEMASIQKMMGDPGSDYWKGPKAPILQARFRELAEGQEKLKRRA